MSGWRGDRLRDDLPAAEVVDRGEVGLAPGLPELGDVGAHLLPGSVGGEVPADYVLEGLACRVPVRVAPVSVNSGLELAGLSARRCRVESKK